MQAGDSFRIEGEAFPLQNARQDKEFRRNRIAGGEMRAIKCRFAHHQAVREPAVLHLTDTDQNSNRPPN